MVIAATINEDTGTKMSTPSIRKGYIGIFYNNSIAVVEKIPTVFRHALPKYAYILWEKIHHLTT